MSIVYHISARVSHSGYLFLSSLCGLQNVPVLFPHNDPPVSVQPHSVLAVVNQPLAALPDQKRTTKFQYTETGDLSTVNSGKGSEKTEYTQDGKVDRIVYPSGKTVCYTYDTLGNVTGVDFSGSQQSRVEYDASGRVATTQDKLGTASYSYDETGALAGVRYSEGYAVGYEYDVFGNVTALTYPDGSIVHYTYDALNRVQSMTDTMGKTTYGYDANGNLLQETRPDGTQTVNTYDAAGRKTSTVNAKPDGSVISSYRYTYDLLGQVIREDAYSAADGSLVREFEYGTTGDLVKLRETANGAATETIYSYDVFGNKLSERSSGAVNRTVQFRYNELNQLTEKAISDGVNIRYEYDSDGNLVKETEGGVVTSYTYTGDNKLEDTYKNGKLMTRYVYDANGLKAFELLRKEFPYTYWTADTEGMEPFDDELLGWRDYFEQQANETVLTRVDEKSARRHYMWAYAVMVTLGDLAPTLSSSYMDFAKQLWKDLLSLFTSDEEEWYNELIPSDDDYISEQKGTSTGDPYSVDAVRVVFEPTRYVYDLTYRNAQLLAEQATASTTRDSYTYGAAARESNLQDRETYLYDGRGSVSEITSNGRVTATLRYDVYGELRSGAPEQDRTFGFNGEQYTPQNGLQYLRARHYDPAMGVFTTQDSYLGNLRRPLSQNRYAYCENDPIGNIDPSGHKVSSAQSYNQMLFGGGSKPSSPVQNYFPSFNPAWLKPAPSARPSSGAPAASSFDWAAYYAEQERIRIANLTSRYKNRIVKPSINSSLISQRIITKSIRSSIDRLGNSLWSPRITLETSVSKVLMSSITYPKSSSTADAISKYKISVADYNLKPVSLSNKPSLKREDYLTPLKEYVNNFDNTIEGKIVNTIGSLIDGFQIRAGIGYGVYGDIGITDYLSTSFGWKTDFVHVILGNGKLDIGSQFTSSEFSINFLDVIDIENSTDAFHSYLEHDCITDDQLLYGEDILECPHSEIEVNSWDDEPSIAFGAGIGLYWGVGVSISIEYDFNYVYNRIIDIWEA